MRTILFALAAFAFAAPAAAQNFPTTTPGDVAKGVVPLQCDALNAACAPATTANPVPMAVKPATAGGLTNARVVTGTSGFIKASAGQVFQVTAYSSNAGVRYLHLYNKASAPTLSTDTPVITIPLLGASVRDVNLGDSIGREFATGIAWAYTTDDVAIPVTAATSAELHFSIGYK